MNLIRAAAEGNKAKVKKLLNYGVPCDWQDPERSRNALAAAAAAGHREVAALLLAKGASVDKAVMIAGESWTPLHIVAHRGHRGTHYGVVAFKGCRCQLREPAIWIHPTYESSSLRPLCSDGSPAGQGS